MADLTPDEQAELDAMNGGAGKPLSADEEKELAALNGSPAGPGPWRSRLVPHSGLPADDSENDVPRANVTLGPTPATFEPSNPERDIAEAKADTAEYGGVVHQTGKTIKGLANAAADLPRELIEAPREAADSAIGGAASAMFMGSAAQDLQKLTAMRERIVAGKTTDEDKVLMDRWAKSPSRYDENDQLIPPEKRLTDPLQVIDHDIAVSQRQLDLEQRNPGAQLAGAMAAPSPGKYIAGGLATALPAAATVVGRTARAAAVGAGSGFVEGTARGLSEGQPLADAAQTGVEFGVTGGLASGAMNLATEPIRAVAAGAPKRVETRETQALLRGVPATTQTKALDTLGGKSGLRTEVAREGLAPAMKTGPEQLAEATEQVRGEVGGRLGQIYKRADQVGIGTPLSKVTAALEKVKQAWADAGDPQAVAAIEKEQAGLQGLFGTKNVRGGEPHISAESLQGVVQRLGKRGYGQRTLGDVSDGVALARDMHGAVRDVLQSHVDEMAKNYPQVGSLDELKDLNRRYTNLKAVQDLADAKTARLQREAPTTLQHLQSLKNAIAGGVGAVGAASTMAAGGGWKASMIPVAVAAGARVAPPLAAAADRALARLALGVHAKQLTPALITSAIQAGVPREVITGVLDRAGVKDVELPAEPTTGDGPTAQGY